MVSTESTVTEFLMPDTVRLVQWPVITTVLDMPLTLTMLSLQAIVRFTLTPETLRLAPAGGRVVAGCAVGVGTARETDGVGERTTKLPWESRCALNAAMPQNPVGFDRPQFFGQYRDSRQNVFLDGNSNLVLRATREGNRYFGGLVHGLWRGGIGTTWEARIKFNCLAPGMWPAWWLSNDDPGRSGEIDLIEWYGNGTWPSGTTVHANPDGTAFETCPIGVDGGWHNWRVTWNPSGMYFWLDYADGIEPYFSVPATGIEDLNEPIREWPFNDPGYTVFPVLNLAVGGSGGGDPATGSYPQEMLVDWVRVF